MSAVGLIAVILLLGCAQRTARPIPDGTALADFDRRVKAYAALRDVLETGPAKLDETAKPVDLVAAELALAAKIKRARATAKRGDIFTPPIQARFRQLLNPGTSPECSQERTRAAALSDTCR